MQIIRTTPNENGGRPPLQLRSLVALPDGYTEVICDTSVFCEYRGFVTLTIEDGKCIAMEGNQEALDTYLAEYPDTEPEQPADIQTQLKAMSVLALATMGIGVTQDELVEAQQSVMSASGVEVATDETGIWKAGEWVEKGAVRTYGSTDYECIQPHVTQSDWTPDKTPALWVVKQAEPEPGQILPWVVGEAVKAGDKRTYGGKTYECITGHTTQATWTPPSVPAIWFEVSV